MKEKKLLDVIQGHPGGGFAKRVLDEPAIYEFKVAHNLSNQWAAWFDNLDLSGDDQGNTLIRGTIIDQAALHGVLARIRDLNLVLLSVVRK